MHISIICEIDKDSMIYIPDLSMVPCLFLTSFNIYQKKKYINGFDLT